MVPCTFKTTYDGCKRMIFPCGLPEKKSSRRRRILRIRPARVARLPYSRPSSESRASTIPRRPLVCGASFRVGQALDRLVAVSSMHYCTSTSALSTLSSSRGLTLTMGYLFLRGASRLDAFSVYPVPTWLPGYALGSTTGTPEVSPSRSSRTKDSSSQISCARAG